MNASIHRVYTSIHVGKIHWELGEHIENLPQLHWVQYNLTFFVDVGTQFANVMEIFLKHRRNHLRKTTSRVKVGFHGEHPSKRIEEWMRK
jgi:hypothetical protein